MWKYIDKNQCNEFLLSLHLINCKDSNTYLEKLYAISNRIDDNYKIYKIKKRNGKYRTIYNPNPTLKHIQRQILNNILNNKSISKYAKAYHKGMTLVDNALPHVNKKIILKLDIKDFFNNISFNNVYNSCFSIEYFPKSIGMLLTYLCTYNDYIPQGAPTSSYISNLVMKEFDNEIGAWCENDNISYTRYSDDMTFSGDFNPKIVITRVRKRLNKLGLQLNDQKTNVISKSNSQNVTGIVVNEKIQINSKYRSEIRKEVYYINKYGVDSHIERIKYKLDKDKYLNNLYGRIIFVLQIDKYNEEFIKYKQIIKNLM
jgi:hypothetical protein